MARRLTTKDAVVIGLGSMIGAGIFSVFGPAAAAAGSGLLIGLVIAAIVAYCNAVASAQLAAVYPASGGTYVYGRERLGHWWGFAAGWSFLIGKTASCAAMAMTVAAYAITESATAQRVVAIVVVAVITWLNCRGVTRTVQVTRVLVVSSLTCLGILVGAILFAGTIDTTSRLYDGWSDHGLYGILQAGGLIFFAFAGYARIATMGEEVVNPRVTLPRAIPLALLITVAVYLVVAIVALLAAGSARLAESDAPLLVAVQAAGVGEIGWLVRVGGFVAASGALLGLIAGIGRTGLAMARHGDLPAPLARVDPVHLVPVIAQVVVGVVVCLVLLVADLRGAIGFSSFGVLLYYTIANFAAWTQPVEDRRWPRWLQAVGIVGCLTLAITLPPVSVVLGIVVLAIGVGFRVVMLRGRQKAA